MLNEIQSSGSERVNSLLPCAAKAESAVWKVLRGASSCSRNPCPLGRSLLQRTHLQDWRWGFLSPLFALAVEGHRFWELDKSNFGGWVVDFSCNAGHTGSISVWGRSPGGGNDNPFQQSCLGNPLDRRAWWTMVHGFTKCLMWLGYWAQAWASLGDHCSAYQAQHTIYWQERKVDG